MNHIPKYKIPVRISLVQDDSVLGVIFIRQEQRILDMLCDQNRFFPVSTKTGTFLINKTSVVKVEVLEADYILEHQDNFPETDVNLGHENHAELARRRSRSANPEAFRSGAGTAGSS
jgi:hypothetical protein